jgi:hypothetical protein
MTDGGRNVFSVSPELLSGKDSTEDPSHQRISAYTTWGVGLAAGLRNLVNVSFLRTLPFQEGVCLFSYYTAQIRAGRLCLAEGLSKTPQEHSSAKCSCSYNAPARMGALQSYPQGPDADSWSRQALRRSLLLSNSEMKAARDQPLKRLAYVTSIQAVQEKTKQTNKKKTFQPADKLLTL